MRRSLRLVLVHGLLVAAAVAVGTAPGAAASPTGYVTVSDGTQIAISVHYPRGYRKGARYPSVLEMSGYDGGSAQGQTVTGDVGDLVGVEDPPKKGDSRQNTVMYTDRGYVVVHASLRGTGCSGGEFDLFSWRSALDGRELVEWMGRQPWSTGKVGVTGHSYSGITGFMIAATQPRNLVAVQVSGLIDDLYRGMVYPGGVSNYGFPLAWSGAIRPVQDVGGGTAPGITRDRDLDCESNVATHRRTLTDDPLVEGLADTDNAWWRSRSLIEYVDRVDVPLHVWGAYQDQETGPRGPAHLWEEVRGVPKRLVLGNGSHDGWRAVPFVVKDKVDWMDHWMGVRDHGFGRFTRGVASPRYHSSVKALYDLAGPEGRLVPSSTTSGAHYPFESTGWQEWHLQPGGLLGPARPPAVGGSDSYLSGTARQSYSYQAGTTAGSPLTTASAPDELRFTSAPFARPTALAGPATARLFLSSTETDTEVFVQLWDVAPNGDRTALQRGVLRASHRALTLTKSDRLPDGRVYRPFHPHTNPQPVVPGQVQEYLVEIFPVGHVFRPGHRLQLLVTAPPAVDSFYIYVPRRVPASLNTVVHDAAHPSRLLLPFVPLDGNRLGPAPACGAAQNVRCISAG